MPLGQLEIAVASMKPVFEIQTPRLVVRYLGSVAPDLVHRYLIENRAAHAPWEPVRDENYFSLEYWTKRLSVGVPAAGTTSERRFALLSVRNDEVLGMINFTNIVGYPFRACHLGYAIATRHEGKGLMREGLQHAITTMFEECELNRIMANFLPRNFRSARLLSSLGFRVEGFAKNYLHINGSWEDHILSSLVRSDWNFEKP